MVGFSSQSSGSDSALSMVMRRLGEMGYSAKYVQMSLSSWQQSTRNRMAALWTLLLVSDSGLLWPRNIELSRL